MTRRDTALTDSSGEAAGSLSQKCPPPALPAVPRPHQFQRIWIVCRHFTQRDLCQGRAFMQAVFIAFPRVALTPAF